VTRPQVIGDLRLRAERAEARVRQLEREIANYRFAAAARGKPAPVEPRHGWDVE
jgi:hypothetical protein